MALGVHAVRAMYTRRVVLACALWACAGRAGAQSSEPPPAAPPQIPTLTLAQALDAARSRNPRILAAQARVRAREAEAQIPRARWYPTVGGAAQVLFGTANNSSALYVAPHDVDLPRVGGTTARTDFASSSATPYGSSLLALGVSQEVFDFGRIAALSAAADAAVDVERHRGELAWLDVELAVREAYFAVHAARGVVQASEDAYQRELAHRALAQAWVAQGLRPRIDLVRADADVARLDVGRVHAQGGLRAAQVQFAASVGVDAPMLDAANDTPSPAATPSLESALGEARARDPLVRALEAQIAQQHFTTRAVGATMRPDVALTSAVSLRAGGAPVGTPPASSVGDGLLPTVPNWDVGIVLRWPIFDATVLASERASQRAEDALRAQLGAVRQEQVAAIEQAWFEVDEAQRTLPALQRSVDATRANYEQADARFRSGLGSAIELADAEALRIEAEVQLALGTFTVARTRARLSRAIAEGP